MSLNRTATRASAAEAPPPAGNTPRSLSPTSTAQGSTIITAEKAAVQNELANSNKWKKLLLLFFFCISQFIEAVNLCALFTSIVDIAPELNLTDSDAVWLLSAYQLTFASFLLLSGRVADVYNPSESSIHSLISVHTARLFTNISILLQNMSSILASEALELPHSLLVL
jgi:hypothetical protein